MFEGYFSLMKLEFVACIHIMFNKFYSIKDDDTAVEFFLKGAKIYLLLTATPETKLESMISEEVVLELKIAIFYSELYLPTLNGCMCVCVCVCVMYVQHENYNGANVSQKGCKHRWLSV